MTIVADLKSGTLQCGADGAQRIVDESGATVLLVTPAPALSVESIGELAGAPLQADDEVELSTDLDESTSGGIVLRVNGRQVASGFADEGKTIWRRQESKPDHG